MFKNLIEKGFQVLTLHHAEAILSYDMPEAAEELERALVGIELPVVELIEGGGGEGELTQRLRRALSEELGWIKHSFEIKKIVDGKERESVSHEIDHVKAFDKGTVALEIEWNNKDPFFDRDLENFKRLHADGAISVGVIVTRGESLQENLRPLIAEFASKNGIGGLEDLKKYYAPTARQERLIRASVEARGSFPAGWANVFVSDKFGEATTHWRKLADRVDRGVGNPCPLLLIGIPREVVTL